MKSLSRGQQMLWVFLNNGVTIRFERIYSPLALKEYIEYQKQAVNSNLPETTVKAL